MSAPKLPVARCGVYYVTGRAPEGGPALALCRRAVHPGLFACLKHAGGVDLEYLAKAKAAKLVGRKDRKVK